MPNERTILADTLRPLGDVVAQMDRGIEYCIYERSRLGYLAALYCNVTVQVQCAPRHTLGTVRGDVGLLHR